MLLRVKQWSVARAVDTRSIASDEDPSRLAARIKHTHTHIHRHMIVGGHSRTLLRAIIHEDAFGQEENGRTNRILYVRSVWLVKPGWQTEGEITTLSAFLFAVAHCLHFVGNTAGGTATRREDVTIRTNIRGMSRKPLPKAEMGHVARLKVAWL